jgi:hypothetical protein
MTNLFKYRSFGVNSLRELCESEVYFSDPKKFNDPLDCSPTLINDVNLGDLEKLCHRMILKNHNEDRANREIHNYRYQSTEFGDYKTNPEVQNYYVRMIADEVKCQLDHMMKSRGVLSLSNQWNSPLMWSHYADEHRGICIGYNISRAVCESPKMVDYKGRRGICISHIIDFIFNNSETSKEEIERKYFYTKAAQWDYEEEWRYVSDSQGSQSIPFPLSSVYFGMRCEISVVSSIVKLLGGVESKVNFYKTYASQDSFDLHRRKLEIEELMARTPRPSARLAFGSIKDE